MRQVITRRRKSTKSNKASYAKIMSVSPGRLRPGIRIVGGDKMAHILQMRGITKEFPGVRALDEVDICVRAGEIHGLVGENGAGKSTLMKVLSGVHPFGTYSGDIFMDGEQKKFHNVRDSEASGIGIIYQELMLVPELSIAENILLGRTSPIVNWERLMKEAQKWMEIVGLHETPEQPVKNIGVGKQQLVEIAKALSLNARLLILDEPTAALTSKEVDHLLAMLDEIRRSGVTCIYISHKLEEVLRICDTITVLRDGRTVETLPASEWDEKKLISKMVGRDFSNRFPKHLPCTSNRVAFEVRNISVADYANPERYILRNISFAVKKGEIVGIAGLMGAGRTELVNSLFGDFKGRMSGEIYIDGRQAKIKTPLDAINQGLGLLTEDRKYNGLSLGASIQDNITLASLKKLSRLGVMNENLAIRESKTHSERINIKASSLEMLTMNLSGGNQQKVIIAKWFMVNPRVLMFDEPTRGIDVGAKLEVYNILNQLKQDGIAIIMVSSELPEILGMSDRIIVIKEGRLVGEFANENMTEEMVMAKATGGA